MNVDPLQGCRLCSDHQVVRGELLCASPIVAGALGTVTCERARYSEGGGCGRDATHMQWAPLLVAARPGPIAWAAQ